MKYVLAVAAIGLGATAWLVHARLADESSSAVASLVLATPSQSATDRPSGPDRASDQLRAAIDRELVPSAAVIAAVVAHMAAATATSSGSKAVADDSGLDSLLVGLQATDPAAARHHYDAAIVAGEPVLGGYLLAYLHLTEGHPAEARSELQQVLRQAPNWTAAQCLLAIANSRLGHRVDLDVVQAAVARWPGSAMVAGAFARILETLAADPEAGREWYRQAVELGATDPHTLERFTSLAMDDPAANASVPAATQTLAALAERHPQSAATQLQLSRLYRAAGDQARSQAALAAALELQPESAAAQLAQSRMGHHEGGHPGGADHARAVQGQVETEPGAIASGLRTGSSNIEPRDPFRPGVPGWGEAEPTTVAAVSPDPLPRRGGFLVATVGFDQHRPRAAAGIGRSNRGPDRVGSVRHSGRRGAGAGGRQGFEARPGGQGRDCRSRR